MLLVVSAGGIAAPAEPSSAGAQARIEALEAEAGALREAVDLHSSLVTGIVASLAAPRSGSGIPTQQFLRISNVSGESTDDRHKDEIEILSWSWGESQSVLRGGAGGAGAGKVSMQDLHLTKRVDAASPLLMLGCAKGQHFDEAVLSVRKANTSQDFLVVTLEDVIVSSYQVGQGEGGGPVESLSLNFAQIEVSYLRQRADGSYDAPIRSGWDVARNAEP